MIGKEVYEAEANRRSGDHTATYECHITISPGCANLVQEIVKIKKLVESTIQWKFSMIEGDPDLGLGMRCYATKWFKTLEGADNGIHKAALDLMLNGLTLERKKIEKVVHDWRVVQGVFKEVV
jgi:hypothetical protein